MSDGKRLRSVAVPLLAGIVAVVLLVAFARLVAREDATSASVVAEPRLAPIHETRARVRDEAPAPPPPRSIRVAVTSMDGRPIPGARVELVRGPVEGTWRVDDGPPSADAPKPERSTVAGADGAAIVGDVPPGRWFVVASAPGFARHVLLGVTRGEEDAPLDEAVALETGSVFSGTIRDPDGAPAVGVDVVLEPRSNWPNDAERLRTKTDADGAYRFDAVEAGRYSLWYSVRPGFLIEETQLMVPSLDGLDIRMVRGASVDGVVRDAETGDAVAGARVFGIRRVESHNSADPGSTTVFDVVTVDHLGRFALRTWRPQFEVSWLLVDAPGYAPTPVDASGRGPPGAVCDGQRLAFDLRLRRAVTLKGTLSTADGPLAGFRVRVSPKDSDEEAVPQSGAWTSTTAADGSFVVDGLPAGPAEIWIADPASDWHSTEGRDVELVAGDSTIHEVRIDVQRVRVKRRVLDAKDAPVEGVDVVQRFGMLRAEARTDASGRFTMDAISAGDTSFVELRRGPFRTMAMMSISDEDDSVLFPTLPFAPEVAGVLIRQDGTPAAGERLTLWSGVEGVEGSVTTWAGLGESISAADGTFRIPLPSGPDFRLIGSRVGWIDGERGDDGSFKITLPAVVKVGGVAVGDDGAPVAGARIRFDGDTVVARSGADGRFAFSWTPPFDQPLTIACDGGILMCVMNDVDDQRISLIRSHAVAGTVRNADGSPASGLRVVVRKPDASGEAEWTETSATDADGRFVVPGLADGPCVVSVTDPVHLAFACAKTTATAGDEHVALVVRPGVRLEVEVVASDGDDVLGACVTAHPANASLADDETRSPAVFAVIADETYTIRVEHEDYETAEQSGVRGGGDPVRIVLKKKD